MNIVFIVGNNLNEESGINNFNYYDDIKSKDYISKNETYIKENLKYKFPNYSHQKIIDFVKKYKDKHNIIIFDQSYFNFFEQIDDNLNIVKLEKDISKFKCLICNRTNKTKTCEKCKIDCIHNFPILQDTFPNYKKLLQKIGMKKLMDLNFKFTEEGENQPIWTLDTKYKIKTMIISIGMEDTVVPMEMYFQDIVKLDNKKIFNVCYLDNKISNMNIDYRIKIESYLISEKIDEFLLEVEKIII